MINLILIFFSKYSGLNTNNLIISLLGITGIDLNFDFLANYDGFYDTFIMEFHYSQIHLLNDEKNNNKCDFGLMDTIEQVKMLQRLPNYMEI